MNKPYSLSLILLGNVTYISRVQKAALALSEIDNINVTILGISSRDSKRSEENLPYKVKEISISSRAIDLNFFKSIRIFEGITRMMFQIYKQDSDVYMPVGIVELVLVFVISRFRKTIIIYNSNELEGGRKRSKNIYVQNKLDKIIKITEKYILKRINGVIAADLERAKIMEDWYGLEKVNVVRNVPMFQECKKGEKFHNVLNLDSDTKVVLYQGLISRGRGLEAVIKASAKIRDVKFVIVLLGIGKETYINVLKQLASELNFKHLYYLPPVPWDELLDWTSCADVNLSLIENVSKSYYLAAPNKIYEGLMAGVPYVASNFPEIKHVHNKAKAGLLSNPDDIESIEYCIHKLLTDEQFRLKCKENALKVRGHFSWENEKIKLLEIINKVKVE